MTEHIDARHGYVWRWCFAVRGSTQVLHGWGSWGSRAEAAAELRAQNIAAKRRGLAKAAYREVRRVPCNLQPLDEWPTHAGKPTKPRVKR